MILAEPFAALCKTLNPKKPEIAAGWAIVLDGLYAEPYRAYHTGRHILDLLRRRTERDLLLDRPELDVAIFFHDAIYRIPAVQNEDESAQLAIKFLGTIDRLDLADTVDYAIMATKHEDRSHSRQTSRAMVDLDLAGFADPWDEFQARNLEIRREYSSVPDEVYAAHRVAFLAGLQKRQGIYQDATDLEEAARVNIRRHMLDLMHGKIS